MSDDVSIPNSGFRGRRAGRYGLGKNPKSQGVDPDTRRLLMFAGGLGAVLVVLIGASAVMNKHSSGVPVITADPRPIREKPANPGGMKIDGAENDVFSGGSDTRNARLAAGAEVPDPKALRTIDAPQSPADIAPAVPPTAATPSAVPGTNLEARPATKPQTAPMTASPMAAAPVTAPTPRATAVPATKPAVVAAAKPAIVASAPQEAAKPSQSRPAAAVETHGSAVSGRQPMVQLAALGSEEAARAEWQQLSKHLPDLLGGRQPSFSKVEHDGRTFWRIRTGGFGDLAQARAFCERVRAKGTGCSVADF